LSDGLHYLVRVLVNAQALGNPTDDISGEIDALTGRLYNLHMVKSKEKTKY
jgi:hypothetical protein